MAYEMRPYQGPEDLKIMQSLIQRNWDLTCRQHIGDIAWGWHGAGSREADWPVALWFLDDVCVGWGWIELPGELWLKVGGDHPLLVHEIVAWFEATAAAKTLQIVVLDKEALLIDPIVEHGYSALEGGVFSLHMMRDLGKLPEVVLPEGFSARSMADDVSLEVRAQAHALAWSLLPFEKDGAPDEREMKSKVTAKTHGAVMNAWPYRRELDWIVLGPDGTPAACCIIWLDEVNNVAELEPVGTHPQYRELGLGSAICLAAMRAAREAGASRAIVYPRGDAAYPVPQKLYRSLGFESYGRSVMYQKMR